MEHSGLGRYGDSLNPWGDLITMAQAWCLLKPGARALVGLPSEFSKAEYTNFLFNATFGSGKKLCKPNFVLSKLSGIS